MKTLSALLKSIALIWLSTSWSFAGFVINPYRFVVSAPGGDPHFANVVWLLHCETSAFLDSSPVGRTPNLINSPVSSTPAKFGSAAYQANGARYIWASSSDFTFGTGDFTVEMWIRFSVANKTLFDCRPGAVNGPYMVASTSSSGVYSVAIGTSGAGIVTLNSSFALSADTWYHMAVSRSGTTAKLFIDGVTQDTKTSSLNITQNSFYLTNNRFNAGLRWVGGIDEVRITKGVARYTADFTPPTAAFPDA